ncbi:MAG: hypothetical protein SGI88_19975 [Candidatus Hydrogenedentes bacterium]|nr:hypothetical protein [Candidatus Hydrogenedentota bacterium]
MLRQRVWFAALLLIVGVACVPAHANVQVSITITGTVEELIPILQKLQELGLGGAPAADDPLKLNVHSVMSEDEPMPAVVVPSFTAAAVEPAMAKAGDSVLITATVADLGRHVDTVAASIGGGARVDLFDNGTEGDVTAGDQIWSRQTVLPAIPAGEVIVSISAYNANGEAIVTQATGEDAPLTTEAKMTVTP